MAARTGQPASRVADPVTLVGKLRLVPGPILKSLDLDPFFKRVGSGSGFSKGSGFSEHNKH